MRDREEQLRQKPRALLGIALRYCFQRDRRVQRQKSLKHTRWRAFLIGVVLRFHPRRDLPRAALQAIAQGPTTRAPPPLQEGRPGFPRIGQGRTSKEEHPGCCGLLAAHRRGRVRRQPHRTPRSPFRITDGMDRSASVRSSIPAQCGYCASCVLRLKNIPPTITRRPTL